MKKQLTYSEALETLKTQEPIKTHVFEKYPNDIKVLGRYGHGMTDTSINNTLKLAKKNKDEVLINLIEVHKININRIYNS